MFPAPTTIATSTSSARTSRTWFAIRSIWAGSEERRVGKECRSLCDWSSDVCSSDLALQPAVDVPGADDDCDLNVLGTNLADLVRDPLDLGGIGRASCRERV